MDPKYKAPIAVTIGVGAVATIILANVNAWPLDGSTFALLGSLAGLVTGYLIPSPGTPPK